MLVLVGDDICSDPIGLCRRAVDHVGADWSVMPSGPERLAEAEAGLPLAANRLTAADRRELFEQCRDDVAELEGLTGLDLSRWRPGPDGGTSQRVRERLRGRWRSR